MGVCEAGSEQRVRGEGRGRAGTAGIQYINLGAWGEGCARRGCGKWMRDCEVRA
jgi:hypothetical protein